MARRKSGQRKKEKKEKVEEEVEEDDEEEKLTLELGHSVVRGVDALEAEEALRLQDENQRAPSKQHAAEAQALQQARGQGEEVSHPHGDQLTPSKIGLTRWRNTLTLQRLLSAVKRLISERSAAALHLQPHETLQSESLSSSSALNRCSCPQSFPPCSLSIIHHFTQQVIWPTSAGVVDNK